MQALQSAAGARSSSAPSRSLHAAACIRHPQGSLVLHPARLQFTVYTRQTRGPSPYRMAFTDAELDVDVSSKMWHDSLFEPGYTAIW